MLKIRRVEERIQAVYPQGDMRCPTHFSIGQEAVAAGVCRNLSREDHVISAHRSHAHYIGKGGNLRAMFAELYGKVDGCASGKGGSMHLIDLSVNFLGCVPIVGSTIPIGVGASFGAMLQGREFVPMDDLLDMAPDVLRHRLATDSQTVRERLRSVVVRSARSTHRLMRVSPRTARLPSWYAATASELRNTTARWWNSSTWQRRKRLLISARTVVPH